MHTKLIIFGAVLIIAVVFGFWFWGAFTVNQDQLAAPIAEPFVQSPTPSPQPAGAGASIESELNAIDLTGLDAEASEMDLSGL